MTGAESSMHVVYVTMQFPVPTETFATNEVRTLTRHGVSVTVHALKPPHEDAANMVQQRGVEHVRITHNGWGAFGRGMLAALRRPALTLNTIVWVIRVTKHHRRDMLASLVLLPRALDILSDVEQAQPDIVHMYWGHFPALVGHLVQQCTSTVATSISMVAYDLMREYGAVVEVARKADIVRTHAVVNKPHIARFTGVPEEAISVIYNGVDLEWLHRMVRGHSRVPRRVFVGGTLTPNKGTADAIRSFAALGVRWPDASMVIAGDGPERRDLEALCRTLRVYDRVSFLGHVEHARVIAEMAQAEVVVALSRAPGERLPNVVKEGMASGCVCVVTATPGIDELIQDGVTGFIVPTSDPPAVTNCIDLVFAGVVDRHEMTEAAREHIRKTFDLDQTAPRYVKLWRDASRRRRSSAEPSTLGLGLVDGASTVREP